MNFFNDDSDQEFAQTVTELREELDRTKKKRRRRKKKGGGKKKLKKLDKRIRKISKKLKEYEKSDKYSQKTNSGNDLKKVVIKESINAMPKCFDSLLQYLSRRDENKDKDKDKK